MQSAQASAWPARASATGSSSLSATPSTYTHKNVKSEKRFNRVRFGRRDRCVDHFEVESRSTSLSNAACCSVVCDSVRNVVFMVTGYVDESYEKVTKKVSRSLGWMNWLDL